ncbi:MAG TPA: hypothetical protein VFY65_17235 [Longimicrobium sp.]|nr:hypothetical protein [Longimicrobium sp.]
MPKQDVSDALAKLEHVCAEHAESESSTADRQTARTILAAVRCAQDHLASVETAAVLEKRWEDVVGSIESSTSQIGRSSLRYYGSDSDIDEFLVKIRALPVRTRGSHQRITPDLLQQTRRDAEALLDELRRLQQQHEERLNALTQRVAAAAETAEARAQAADQFRKEVGAAETRRTEAFDQLLSRFQKSFGAFETQVRERLDAELLKQRETFEESAKAFSDEARRLEQHASETSAAVLEELQRHLSRAEEIVGVVSKTALAGSYSEVAERERKDANVWRWISVASMIGIIVCAVFALVHSLSVGFSPNAFTAKIVTSFAFMILAAYAGRESARHRKSEQHARRMQLELATIDSYLLSLPDEQRHAIKAAVADRIFGQPVQGEKVSSDAEASPPPLLEYLRLVLGGGEKT